MSRLVQRCSSYHNCKMLTWARSHNYHADRQQFETVDDYTKCQACFKDDRALLAYYATTNCDGIKGDGQRDRND